MMMAITLPSVSSVRTHLGCHNDIPPAAEVRRPSADGVHAVGVLRGHSLGVPLLASRTLTCQDRAGDNFAPHSCLSLLRRQVRGRTLLLWHLFLLWSRTYQM